MAGSVRNLIDDFNHFLQRLSSRERAMIGGLGVALIVVIVVVVGYFIFAGLEEIEENNRATRRALKEISLKRECYMIERRRRAQLESRISRSPLDLNTFVDTAAAAAGVNIPESTMLDPVVIGRYKQRGISIKLRKVTIDQLAKLMKELEGSPHIVQITRLSINTRWNEHKDLDVEMEVSTFEHNKKIGGRLPNGKQRDRERT